MKYEKEITLEAGSIIVSDAGRVKITKQLHFNVFEGIAIDRDNTVVTVEPVVKWHASTIVAGLMQSANPVKGLKLTLYPIEKDY